MIAAVDTDHCPACGRWLPWAMGRLCVQCRDADEQTARRQWIEDHG